MNVICSISNEEITREECLQCSLEGRNVCGYDYVVLKAIFGANDNDWRRKDVHVTDMTGCLRNAYYGKVSPLPEVLHDMEIRSLGTWVHSCLEQEDELFTSELPVEFENVVGSADVVYKDGRLLDFKSTRWMYPHKLPYSSHEMQVNMYAHILRGMGKEINKLQIQYIDMSGPTKCRACRVPVRMIEGILKCPECNYVPKNAHLGAALVDVALYPEEYIQEIFDRRRTQLADAIEMQIPPAKEPGYLCVFCSHREVCKPEEN